MVLGGKPLIIYYFNARSFKVAGELQPAITVMQGLRNWMFMQLQAPDGELVTKITTVAWRHRKDRLWNSTSSLSSSRVTRLGLDFLDQ